MRKTLFAILMVISIGSASYAQDETRDVKKLYLGLSTGIDNPVGFLGFTAEYQFVKNLSAYGGVGLGTWGGKAALGMRYYLNYPGSWAFGIGWAGASGAKDVKIKVEQEDNNTGTKETNSVTFDLDPVSTINLSATKFWLLGKRKVNRLHLELGYAIPLQNNAYTIKDSAEPLSSAGKFAMRIAQPGGIIIGAGFSFGLF